MQNTLTSVVAAVLVAGISRAFSWLGRALKTAVTPCLVLMVGLVLVTSAHAGGVTVMPKSDFGVMAAGTVEIPWGDWLVDLVDAVMPTVLTLLGIMSLYVVTLLPPWVRVFVGEKVQAQINEVLEKAVLSAAAQTKGATAGKTLKLDVSSVVLARAISYAVELAPELVKKATGGNLDALMKMVLARMEDLGLVPAGFDLDKAVEAVAAERPALQAKLANPGAFDFAGSIKKGLGG